MFVAALKKLTRQHRRTVPAQRGKSVICLLTRDKHSRRRPGQAKREPGPIRRVFSFKQCGQCYPSQPTSRRMGPCARPGRRRIVTRAGPGTSPAGALTFPAQIPTKAPPISPSSSRYSRKFRCLSPPLKLPSTPRSMPATASRPPPRARCARPWIRRWSCSTMAMRGSPNARPAASGKCING